MLKIVEANNASTLAEHTPFNGLYTRNFSRSPVERVMPTTLDLAYEKQYGTLPGGYRQSIVVPIIAPSVLYQGPFAITDQVPLERPMPWDRNVT